MPLCKKCNASDPSAFYPYQHGECKDCIRRRVRANRAARIDQYRAFDRERGKKPERKATNNAKQRRMRAANPHMISAHNAVARAVSSGQVHRPSACSRCSSTDRVQAHHDDHAKPLDVLWLCPVCHANRHKELGRLRMIRAAYGPDPALSF